MLIKPEQAQRLQAAHVFVAGLGGVGGFAAEMLCRAGVGALTIADADVVHSSNRNRQLLALASTEGMWKTEAMRLRLLDINPELQLTVLDTYLRDEKTVEILQTPYDYVIDTIDTLSPKVFLIKQALENKHRLVSSMGAGGKWDPLSIRIGDFAHTMQCNLARLLRKRLRKLGVNGGFQAVYSVEAVPPHAMRAVEGEPNKKTTVGTISYMPALFGCYCASVVIRALVGGDHLQN